MEDVPQLDTSAKFGTEHTRSNSGINPQNFGPEPRGLSKSKMAAILREWPAQRHLKC